MYFHAGQVVLLAAVPPGHSLHQYGVHHLQLLDGGRRWGRRVQGGRETASAVYCDDVQFNVATHVYTATHHTLRPDTVTTI